MSTIDAANQSSVDNIREKNETRRVQQQIKVELNELKSDVTVDSFYNVDTATNTVEYDMDLVKDYLNKIKDKSWGELINLKRTAAWIMAVQIALEKLGHDVGKIDGLFKRGGTTEAAVRAFQNQWNSEHTDPKDRLAPDGQPGTKTINALLTKLDVVLAPKYTAKVVTKNEGESLTADELVDGLDGTETSVEFEPAGITPDLTVGPHDIDVKVTASDGTEHVVNCHYEVTAATV